MGRTRVVAVPDSKGALVKPISVGGIKAQQVVTIYIPPLASETVLIAGYDPEDGSIRLLNLGTLHQLQVLAERENIIGILDGRDAESHATVTIPNGTVVGAAAATQRSSLTVTAGEVWFVQAVQLHSPAESAPGAGEIVTCNFRTTRVPDTAATPSALGLPYFGGSPADYVWTINDENWYCEFNVGAQLFDFKYIEKPLRLFAGDTITLEAVLTAANAGAALVADMYLYGYKAPALVT